MSFPSYWSLLHFYDSSVSDIQIDHILHTPIIFCKIVSLQSVGLSYLGMVTCWWIILLSLLPVAWCGFAKFCHYTNIFLIITGIAGLIQSYMLAVYKSIVRTIGVMRCQQSKFLWIKIMYLLIGYVNVMSRGGAPFYLSSGFSTSGRVTRAPGLLLYFHFYWSGVVVFKAGVSCLKVILFCIWLLNFRGSFLPCL